MITPVGEVQRPAGIDPAEADEILGTAGYKFDTGNFCAVTPMAKRCGDGQVRVLINYAWVKAPSSREQAELQTYLRSEFNILTPDWIKETRDPADSSRIADDWLGKGKKPDA